MSSQERTAHFALEEGGWRVDVIVQGYPGKTVCHGGLGWSTIVLLRGHGHTALIDTGSFGQRQPIIDRLSAHGLTPSDVTDVLLTHTHWDHAINWVMFPKARVFVDGGELDWSLKEPWGLTPVPELYVRELAGSRQMLRFSPGAALLPGITAHAAPGHTPGHVIFHLAGTARDVIFTGDAAKNRAEMLSLSADMTYDPAVSRASMEAIWTLWRAKAGSVLIPGHDAPMILEAGNPKYVAPLEAGITAWFGEDLATLTRFDISPKR
jgi:N-acyl homoserine lactone hydrolase